MATGERDLPGIQHGEIQADYTTKRNLVDRRIQLVMDAEYASLFGKRGKKETIRQLGYVTTETG